MMSVYLLGKCQDKPIALLPIQQPFLMLFYTYMIDSLYFAKLSVPTLYILSWIASATTSLLWPYVLLVPLIFQTAHSLLEYLGLDL